MSTVDFLLKTNCADGRFGQHQLNMKLTLSGVLGLCHSTQKSVVSGEDWHMEVLYVYMWRLCAW